MNGTVLIVEDDAAIRSALERAIATPEFTVRACSNAVDAQRILAEEEVALILLDLRMPGVDGMELLRRIARDHPSIRVVIVTAHGSVETAVEAMKLGAVEFVQKPFTAAEIREIVRKHLPGGDAPPTDTYARRVAAAQRSIEAGALDDAEAEVRAAIATRPSGSHEAWNLLGVIDEMRGRRVDAQAHYRVALDLQPDYRAAADNLHRSTRPPEDRGPFSLG